MKRLELGLSQQERDARDSRRRETNCFVAMAVVAVVAFAVLVWIGVPP